MKRKGGTTVPREAANNEERSRGRVTGRKATYQILHLVAGKESGGAVDGEAKWALFVPP